MQLKLVDAGFCSGYKQVCETEHGIPLLNPAAMELSGFIQIVGELQ